MALTIDEFLSRPLPQEKWIVDQLLPANGALYFHGAPKGGKTLFALGMAAAISDNHPKFLDFPIHQTGKVLYLQVDMSPGLWDTYVRRAFDSGHKFSNLHFIDRMEIPEHSLDLTKQKNADWLKGQVDMVQPLVIILDTLRSIHPGDEDNSTVMSNVYEKLLKIIGTTALMIVHHSRKPQLLSDIVADARGSTAVSGRVDVIARLMGGPKHRKLDYLTRDKNYYPDGMKLTQNKKTGLYECVPDPKALLDRLQMDLPHATVKQLVDLLIESGVSKSQAYKVVGGKEGE